MNLLIAINAKYIHTNVAIRSLKANTRHQVELMETTIKDNPQDLIARIVSNPPEVIGFSVYIWNVEIVKTILKAIRDLPTVVVLGGPEVSYDAEPWLTMGLADYVVVGEGEIAFDALLTALRDHTNPDDIPNVVTAKSNRGKQIPIPIADVSLLASPHRFPEDGLTIPSRIQYVETSRGCPYRCSYCLASLDRHVRFFPMERIQDDILHLLRNGAKTIKFLDRTFNLKRDESLAMFAFLIEHARTGIVYQFEITGDLMPLELVDYVNAYAPKGLFRFEIGIQSTNEATNRHVDRIQNNERLFTVIKRLRDADIVDLHLDLIAGLPEETLDRFEQTFNEVFFLRAKEVQLGFLKFLKGTKIRAEANRHGYRFDAEAPYEIQSSNALSETDISTIKRVETILDRAWNKGYLVRALTRAIKTRPSMFAYLLEFSRHLERRGLDPRSLQLTDYFEQWERYHHEVDPDDSVFRDELRRDYIEHHPIRPKLWWNDDVQPHKTQWLERYHRIHPDISMDRLHRHTLVIRYKDGVLLAHYDANGKTVAVLTNDCTDSM